LKKDDPVLSGVKQAFSKIKRLQRCNDTDSMMPPDRRRFAVAPMMEWTDRHCRFFHRLLTRRALLYTRC
jgi:hypothetical protein